VRIALAAAALLLGSAAGAAEPTPVDRVLFELGRASAEVTTLAGEFTQQNRVKLFKQELRSRGRFYFRRPRQIRWEYLAPDPSTLVLDGQRATLRTPGAAPQVFDLERDATMRAIFDQLLIWLGPGSTAELTNDYELSTAGSAAEPVLVLVPRAQSPVARAFRKVELKLDGRTWLLRSILLVEKNGDEKAITFTRLERNARLPEDAFK
jgi:outer membrane lipoprotein carrier protein